MDWSHAAARACNQVLALDGPSEWGLLAMGGDIHIVARTGEVDGQPFGLILLANQFAADVIMVADRLLQSAGSVSDAVEKAFVKGSANGLDLKQQVHGLLLLAKREVGIGMQARLSQFSTGRVPWSVVRLALFPKGTEAIADGPPHLDEETLAKILRDAGING